MQRAEVGRRLITYGIDVGCGLIGGLIGVVQWVMARRDLVARLATFHFNTKTVYTGNLWFWFDTAPMEPIVVCILCLLAAFTACWRMQRQRDGVVAAWVAAAVSSAFWIVATLAGLQSPPAPEVAPILVCGGALGILFFGMLIPSAFVVANIGIQMRQFFSHERHAR